MPALNLANCWDIFNLGPLWRKPAGNHTTLREFGIFRDYSPEFAFCSLWAYFVLFRVGGLTVLNHIINESLNYLGPLFATWAITKDNYYRNLNTSRGDEFKKESDKLGAPPTVIPYPGVNSFEHYLAGVIEGDGSIHVPISERNAKNKLNYPSIQISFALKDLAYALLIQKNLGHGSLHKVKGKNAYVLTINNLFGLIHVVSLINGKLRTPKNDSLWSLIDWLNKKGYSIPKLELDNSEIESNAWLAGFVDADGHFSVRATPHKVECKIEICQRQVDKGGKCTFSFLDKIAKMFKTSVKPIRTNTKNPQFRVRTTSLQGNLLVKSYFDNFPLYSTKYLNYLDWIKVLELFEAKEHKENLKQIIKIKSNMNDNRTVFNWDHLQNFYKLGK